MLTGIINLSNNNDQFRISINSFMNVLFVICVFNRFIENEKSIILLFYIIIDVFLLYLIENISQS